MFKDYGMFSEAGNKAVSGIVYYAKSFNCTWAAVEKALYYLAEDKDFAEATDTAVREAVYIELGY